MPSSVIASLRMARLLRREANAYKTAWIDVWTRFVYSGFSHKYAAGRPHGAVERIVPCWVQKQECFASVLEELVSERLRAALVARAPRWQLAA
eukprot:6146489-Amphidinium_carterae.1